jgi:hypothetical protein
LRKRRFYDGKTLANNRIVSAFWSRCCCEHCSCSGRVVATRPVQSSLDDNTRLLKAYRDVNLAGALICSIT